MRPRLARPKSGAKSPPMKQSLNIFTRYTPSSETCNEGMDMSDHVTFWSDESGAVTVDWVVLTGGVVGLGLATMGVVSGGVENLSGDIAGQLSSDSWNLFGNGMQSVASFDFTGGNADGWLGGQVMDMGGSLGEVLALGAGDATGYMVDIPAGRRRRSGHAVRPYRRRQHRQQRPVGLRQRDNHAQRRDRGHCPWQWITRPWSSTSRNPMAPPCRPP